MASNFHICPFNERIKFNGEKGELQKTYRRQSNGTLRAPTRDMPTLSAILGCAFIMDKELKRTKNAQPFGFDRARTRDMPKRR